MQRDTDIGAPTPQNSAPSAWKLQTEVGVHAVPWGGRICPAQQMVLNQMGYVLARFVQDFETIENRDSVEGFVEEYMLWVQSRSWVKVGFGPAKKMR